MKIWQRTFPHKKCADAWTAKQRKVVEDEKGKGWSVKLIADDVGFQVLVSRNDPDWILFDVHPEELRFLYDDLYSMEEEFLDEICGDCE